MPIGRPTKYKKKYCSDVIEHLSNGRSLASFASSIGTHRQRIWEWREKNPEFQDACLEALELSQEWWEKLSIQISTGYIFHKDHKGKYNKHNPGMVQFIMKQRFSDYRQPYNKEDTQPIEVNINVSPEDLSKMKQTELDNRIIEALKVLEKDGDDKKPSSAGGKGVSKKKKSSTKNSKRKGKPS